MFSITNRYALAEEVTLDIREQKESGHQDQPSSSKGNDKKRKSDRSVNTVEWPHHHKEYRPRPSEFEGFLDHSCIFHPQGKHKTQDYDQLQGFADEVLGTAKPANQGKKPEDPKGDFLEVHKEVNYIFGGPDSYEPRRKQKLTVQEVMVVSPATPSTLDGSRSPLPSTVATTQTLYQSRSGIHWWSAPSSKTLSSIECSWMGAAPSICFF
jgi:hypothetical protein